MTVSRMWLLLATFFVTPYAILSLSTHNGTSSLRANHQHVRSHAHKTFETAVRTYDKDLFHSSLNLLDTMKVEVKGFYHVSTTVGHWNEVLEEHLMVMDGKRFATNLFSSKATDHPSAKQKNTIGMKLSTGWSSVLEIADSIELNFDAATDPELPKTASDGSPAQSAAYTNMTTMLSSLHLRGGAEKIHVKPYSSVVLPQHKPRATESTGVLGLFRSNSKSTKASAAPTEQERRELATVLGEVNSINELHDYCQSRTVAQKTSFVFLMHNQETNCTSDFMRHIAVEDYGTEPFLHDIVNSFIVEFPSICILALLNGYATCGSDFEQGAYDTNIWWANCDHISRLTAIDKAELLRLAADHSYTAATTAGRRMIRSFLFGAPKDAAAFGKTVADRKHFADRCAYNLHSGSKPIDQSVKIVDGAEVPLVARCSRSEYRFSLIDILSGLHDDSVLYNRRYGLPSLASEMYLQDASHRNSHKCF